MLFDFANVLVFTALGLGFVGVNLLIGKLLRPANPQARKLSTYECGEPSMGSAWVNFNIRFYIVALIFIIFEVEIAFIFPVATVFRRWVEGGVGVFALVEVLPAAEFEAEHLPVRSTSRSRNSTVRRISSRRFELIHIRDQLAPDEPSLQLAVAVSSGFFFAVLTILPVAA